jgi:hypothetical protein
MTSDITELVTILQQYQTGRLTVADAADRLLPLVRAHGAGRRPEAMALLGKVPDPRIRELLGELERRLADDAGAPPV